MGSDDNSNVPKPPPGAGLGPSGPQGGEGDIETPDLKTVRLVCLFCREVRLIHVPIECDTPKEVLWECLTCQERWAARKK